MDGRYVEPRIVMWAVAEIAWEDDSGTSFRVPAILEDTSKSGACVRIKRSLPVGSKITVKWHREQFSAITRNCRVDGGDFLLGVRREGETASESKSPAALDGKQNQPANILRSTFAATPRITAAVSLRTLRSVETRPSALAKPPQPTTEQAATPNQRTQTPKQGTSARPERKAMQPKTIFPHFWRRKQDEGAPAKSTTMEAPVNKPGTSEPTPSGPRGELLGYEDIYRAAGIMSPGSGYGIHKVVDMLNSERIRDLSNDVKRASVLMALDAAGISADDLLTDATRRQNALTAYEASQVKQLEDFEARKAKENTKVEEEMEKIRVHYAQRVQANLDQVAKEKEALRNWQMAMQHETQRIAEVIDLCKQPTLARTETATAAAAGAQGAGKTDPPSGGAEPMTPLRPTLGKN